jgi:hypothetical protein
VLTLRALQLGLRIEDLNILTLGELLDLIVERSNDDYNYEQKATTEDIDRLFG